MKTFSFVKNLKVSTIISLILILPGLLSLILLPFGVSWMNFDIDFLGGTVLQYDLNTNVDQSVQADIASIVSGITGVEPTVQRSGDTGVSIKTLDIESDKRQAITDALTAQYSSTVLVQADNVTATVGADLRNAAILSATLAAALILVYITIRFNFKSGLAAVITLIHDLLVMMSCYVIFQIPVNMNFIAAILTILGYSINASIIVFDRVRENRRYMPKSAFGDIVDQSIRQTVNRNINTTITTLLPLIMIIILGVTSVRNFAIPLAVGVVAGAYSSIFLGGPLWALLRGDKKEKI